MSPFRFGAPKADSSRPRIAALLAAALLIAPRSGLARKGGVSETVHNLSASGPGEIRALGETEVCKFCHVPHSAAVPVPLWSRRLPEVRYVTARLRRGRPDESRAPQPDGSSRLCLSCHDGTIALGELAGGRSAVSMAGGGRLASGVHGYIGTDISGSHPVSIAVPEGPARDESRDRDMSLRPLSALRGLGDARLDAEGKVQCTTCHDPHADRYFVPGRVPRFWTKPTVEEVCLTCHVPS